MCDTNIWNWSLVFNHQHSLIENPVHCNVHYYNFPYPFGCINNLENEMCEYCIVEKDNLEPATIKMSLGGKLKSNWHISWTLVSNKELLLIKLVAKLIS